MVESESWAKSGYSLRISAERGFGADRNGDFDAPTDRTRSHGVIATVSREPREARSPDAEL